MSAAAGKRDNSYYWLAIFTKRYQSWIGPDAGVEQQLFQELERAPADVDWQVVEELSW